MFVSPAVNVENPNAQKCQCFGGKALDFPEVLEVERSEPVLTSSSQVSLRVRQPLGTAVSLLENGGYHLYLVKSEDQWGSL